MKIAYISYEYPPDTAVGGIATYVREAARVMAGRGHRVEVFTASPSRSNTVVEDGVTVHRIATPERHEFPALVGPFFRDRHAMFGFDVLEGPDFGADARQAVATVPSIPLVVRLHTSSALLNEMARDPLTRTQILRGWTGAIIRRRKPWWHYDPHPDPEYRHAHDADEIAAPSNAISEWATTVWKLDPAVIARVPNPYIPSNELLRIPLGFSSKTLTFLGRLQSLKGILELADAVPSILRAHPDAQFLFVGKPMASPDPAKRDMQEYLESKLARYRHALHFTGPLPLDHIPQILSRTSVSVVPSRWEAFGYSCLEAMSAGRAVIATRVGGLPEVIGNGAAGRLVPPHDPATLARAAIELLDRPDECERLGAKAREWVVDHFGADRVGRLLEASYERAIMRRKRAGPRNGHVALLPLNSKQL